MEKEPTRREPEGAGSPPAGIAGKTRRAARVAGRRALAALLSAALAAALVPAPALAQDGGGAYVGEGSVALQASGVVVDGTAVSAAALAAALPSMQRVPAAAGGPMSEYAGIIAADAAAAGSLAQVGSSLSLVFLGASCSLLASGILSHGEPAVFVIPAGSVDGVDRDLYVVVASTSAVLVDGVPIGACWLQYDLLSYISGNYDSIAYSKGGPIVPRDVANSGRDKPIDFPDYPETDPLECPEEGWEWKGTGDVESNDGSWVDPVTGSSLRQDLNHPGDIKPHWDYNDKGTGTKWRLYPDGTVQQKA